MSKFITVTSIQNVGGEYQPLESIVNIESILTMDSSGWYVPPTFCILVTVRNLDISILFYHW